MQKRDNSWRKRYELAHREWFMRVYPTAWADGHYALPKYPRVHTSNGLQTAVVNYTNWRGQRAKRINNMGRLVETVEKTPSGIELLVKEWRPSAAGRGQADVASTIRGRSCQLEVKVGRDTPSDKQLLEQIKERNAGGVYEFIHDMDEFYKVFDLLMENPNFVFV